MTEITLSIKDCSRCPFHEVTGTSSTDGWDRGEDWFCTKEQKFIQKFVEWHDKVPVPEWCGLRANNGFQAHIGISPSQKVHVRKYHSAVCSACTTAINFHITEKEFEKLEKMLHTKTLENERESIT